MNSVAFAYSFQNVVQVNQNISAWRLGKLANAHEGPFPKKTGCPLDHTSVGPCTDSQENAAPDGRARVPNALCWCRAMGLAAWGSLWLGCLVACAVTGHCSVQRGWMPQRRIQESQLESWCLGAFRARPTVLTRTPARKSHRACQMEGRHFLAGAAEINGCLAKSYSVAIQILRLGRYI